MPPTLKIIELNLKSYLILFLSWLSFFSIVLRNLALNLINQTAPKGRFKLNSINLFLAIDFLCLLQLNLIKPAFSRFQTLHTACLDSVNWNSLKIFLIVKVRSFLLIIPTFQLK